MGSFRFIHAADIHLDSPLKGLSGLEGSAVELIRSASREAFEALVARAIDESAAFLIIAGDLYDGTWRDYKTGLFFVRQMGRLRDAGIRTFLIYGNHDAESQITRRLGLPDNVTAFSAAKPETHSIKELGVALHGQSFRERDVTENLARGYPDPVPDLLNIGILHTGLAGEEGHQSYAPCTLGELVNKGYDYWALGHIHKPSVRHERPFVVYSGNLQGRHINEAGPRGAVSVSVEDGVISDLAPFHVDLVRWALIDVPVDTCESLQQLVDRIRDGIEKAILEQADGRLLACRIRLSGTSAIWGQIAGSEEWLLAEARSAAQGLGDERAWVERLVNGTAPQPTQGTDPAISEMLGDLADAHSDVELLGSLRSDIGALVAMLPHEVRSQSESELLAAAAKGDYARLIELAGPYAMAHLTEGPA